MTKSRVLGIILLVWGGALLSKRAFGAAPAGSGAYRFGQNAAYILTGIMVVAGLHSITRKSTQPK